MRNAGGVVKLWHLDGEGETARVCCAAANYEGPNALLTELLQRQLPTTQSVCHSISLSLNQSVNQTISLKIRSYITLHFNQLADKFNRAPSRFFLDKTGHAAINAQRFVHKYPPQLITRYEPWFSRPSPMLKSLYLCGVCAQLVLLTKNNCEYRLGSD